MRFSKLLVFIIAPVLAACTSATAGGVPTTAPTAPATPATSPAATASPGQTAPPAVATASPGGANNLANTRWTLVSFGAPGAETPVVEGSTVTLQFGENGQAAGSGGCNSYGGKYQVQGDTLTIRNIIHTEIACVDERVMQQEQHYFEALQSSGKFDLAGDRLTIWYDNEQGVLNFTSTAATSPTPADQSPGATAPTTPGGAWTRQQFGQAWDIEYPADWTVNSGGEHEGAIQLAGQYEEHTYQLSLSYPIGITAQSLEAWVEEQLAALTPEQRAAVQVSDITVAGAPAKKALNMPDPNGQKPTANVYIWRADSKNPRLIVLAQTDDQPLGGAAIETLLDRFIAGVRP